MLDVLLKGIINYVPRESVEDMLNVKIASIDMIEVEKVEEPDDKLEWDALGKENTIMTSTLEMKVVENKAQEVNINKSDNLEDIIKTILDKFEEDYKKGKNFNNVFEVKESEVKNYNRLITLIANASNMIAVNSRRGGGNVAIIPQKFKNVVTPQPGLVNKIYYNPMSDYSNKIFVLHISDQMFEQKYHLLTDRKIPSSRQLKINKILNKENKEINYVILPTHGSNESVVVINIV
jgi:hypothetical protein